MANMIKNALLRFVILLYSRMNAWKARSLRKKAERITGLKKVKGVSEPESPPIAKKWQEELRLTYELYKKGDKAKALDSLYRANKEIAKELDECHVEESSYTYLESYIMMAIIDNDTALLKEILDEIVSQSDENDRIAGVISFIEKWAHIMSIIEDVRLVDEIYRLVLSIEDDKLRREGATTLIRQSLFLAFAFKNSDLIHKSVQLLKSHVRDDKEISDIIDRICDSIYKWEDSSLLHDAYDIAQVINDEKKRNLALLDIVHAYCHLSGKQKERSFVEKAYEIAQSITDRELFEDGFGFGVVDTYKDLGVKLENPALLKMAYDYTGMLKITHEGDKRYRLLGISGGYAELYTLTKDRALLSESKRILDAVDNLWMRIQCYFSIADYLSKNSFNDEANDFVKDAIEMAKTDVKDLNLDAFNLAYVTSVLVSKFLLLNETDLVRLFLRNVSKGVFGNRPQIERYGYFVYSITLNYIKTGISLRDIAFLYEAERMAKLKLKMDESKLTIGYQIEIFCALSKGYMQLRRKEEAQRILKDAYLKSKSISDKRVKLKEICDVAVSYANFGDMANGDRLLREAYRMSDAFSPSDRALALCEIAEGYEMNVKYLEVLYDDLDKATIKRKGS